MNTSPFHRLIASAILICLCTCVIAQTENSVTARRNADSIEDSGHVIAMTDTLTTDSIEADTLMAPRWEDTLRERLNALALEADHSHYYTGVCIYDLTDSTLLYGYNQQKLMRPASNEKTLTAVTALDILGADHKYSTEVYAVGSLVADSANCITDSVGGIVADSTVSYTLKGNIYVVGDFDPSLELADIRQMVGAIRNAGISTIDGSIIADVSMKDTLSLGNGWCWDDSQPYLTPLSLGGSAYTSKPARINRYNPSADFVKTLRNELIADNIGVTGSTGSGVVPRQGNDVVLVTKITHSIEEILHRMMKNSDNLYAESMFYQLAADKKKGASWKDCAAEVEAMVHRAAGSSAHVDVADGCGLSLYNYVSPSVLVAVLRYAYDHKTIFSALYPSLPVAGVDGTIASRMTGSKAYANVHAKTGTVTGVSTLAGYVTASNGHFLAFAIMNNGVKTSAEGRAFQDKVCAVLAE